MHFSCPHCHAQYLIKPEWLGLQVRCPGCQQVVQLPRQMARKPEPPPTMRAIPKQDDQFAFLPGDAESIPPHHPQQPGQTTAVAPGLVRIAPAIREKSLAQKLMLPLILGGVFLVVGVGVSAVVFDWGFFGEDNKSLALDQSDRPDKGEIEEDEPASDRSSRRKSSKGTRPSKDVGEYSSPKREYPTKETDDYKTVDARSATMNYWSAMQRLPQPNIPPEPQNASAIPQYMQTIARELEKLENAIEAIPTAGVDTDLLNVMDDFTAAIEDYREYVEELSYYTPQEFAQNEAEILQVAGQFMSRIGTLAQERESVRQRLNRRYGISLMNGVGVK